MKKILIFVANLLLCAGVAGAAVRDGTALSRTKSDTKNTQQTRTSTTAKKQTARSTTLIPRSHAVSRNTSVAARTQSESGRSTTLRGTAQSRSTSTTRENSNIAARVAVNTELMSTTRTGVEYEQCKNTYFSCMDQFCTLKNDDYRRCSCNDRVFDLADARGVLQDAGEQLTIFTENLDVVGMTAAQATAMRQESEGESALTSDNSASKALLQAIMNSIRGDDSTVGGKYSGLNSINISFDTTNDFGMTDVGQAVAAYDGRALYNAVYPQCREAVRADCNDASLQRAITAYLMAIEQDCNTVQTAIEEKQKEMKAAIREGSAMLDLARIENHQKHNSYDFTSCLNQVENAILSEEVCGANYHKCLDNGQYIDVSTGKPIAGVKDIYQLENLLVFSDGVEAANQKLSKVFNNRSFVQNFEARVKPFAEPALDKCVEDADTVWAEYLDKAMLSIYYAQKAKVSEIKQGCFDYVASCYMSSETAIDAALKSLTADSSVVIQPDKIVLTGQMCSDYIESCNNMFDGNIIEQYIAQIQDTDTLTACRAIVKQCFDKYGGTNYENFFYPYSGLFAESSAPDWFTLYEYNSDGTKTIVSECAKQLQQVDACSDATMIERAFGGLDKVPVKSASRDYEYEYDTDGTEMYGLLSDTQTDTQTDKQIGFNHRYLRSTGVATEVYNQILSILSTQCMNLQGRFVEYQTIKAKYEGCTIKNPGDKFSGDTFYDIKTPEIICPKDYELGVDISSWGICSCWENGGRRSKNGKSAKCMPIVPAQNGQDNICEQIMISDPYTPKTEDDWCTITPSGANQVCPIQSATDDEGEGGNEGKDEGKEENICLAPEGIE